MTFLISPAAALEGAASEENQRVYSVCPDSRSSRAKTWAKSGNLVRLDPPTASESVRPCIEPSPFFRTGTLANNSPRGVTLAQQVERKWCPKRALRHSLPLQAPGGPEALQAAGLDRH